MLRALSVLVLLTSSAYADTVRINATDEIECLALNVYHEARSESLAGQFAVADVVMNRVADKRYPNTICGVVKQAVMSEWGVERGLFIPKKNMCQFSWYCDGQSDAPVEEYAWLRAKDVARDLRSFRKFKGITEGATHYHANYVKPKWSFHKKMTLIGRIGDHIFYKEEF